MTARNEYTFGDNDRASQRLLRLAQLYEPETRQLLERHGTHSARLAVDLGCGPGWSTALVREVLRPCRTVGLDSSQRFVAEARCNHSGAIEFAVHDITSIPFPVGVPDLLLCRFLLTHLRQLGIVLTAWAGPAAPGARLLVHETERLDAEHPSLRHARVLDDGDLLHALLAAARALRDVDREGFRQGLHPREPVAPSLWSPPSSPMALVRAGEAGTTSRRSSERGAKQPK